MYIGKDEGFCGAETYTSRCCFVSARITIVKFTMFGHLREKVHFHLIANFFWPPNIEFDPLLILHLVPLMATNNTIITTNTSIKIN